MKRTTLILLGFLAAYGVPSFAQTYKCTTGGKTVISDQPCGSNAKAIIDSGGGSGATSESSGNPKEVGAQSCKAGVKKVAAWKDPDSLRIDNVVGGEMEVIDHADRKIGARRFSVGVNAKNAIGGYVGERRVVCFTSQDGLRVLKIDNLAIDNSTIN